MVAINRINADSHTWPPETFQRREPTDDDMPSWVVCFCVGLALAWCGVCLGVGAHAGWAFFEWLLPTIWKML